MSVTCFPIETLERRLLLSSASTMGEGLFGSVDGRNRTVSFTEADGTVVSASLKGGGSGRLVSEEGRIRLELDGTGSRSALVLKVRGGADRAAAIQDVLISGSLRSIKAASLDVLGTVSASGSIGSMTLRNVTGGTVAAREIGSLTLSGSLSDATILSGVYLGSDHALGGVDAAADLANPASIARVLVKGAMTSSFVGTGVHPMDGGVGDGNDSLVGGSSIGKITVHGPVSDDSHFAAAQYPTTALLAGLHLDPHQSPTFIDFAPHEPADPSHPTAPSPTDPTHPTDPTPTDPTHPTDPAPTDPTHPTDPTDPAQPTDPAHPSDPTHAV